MSARESNAPKQESESRSRAFDEVESLLKSRIRELEEQRHERAGRSRTFSELVQLLANLERVDELRDVAERVARLRSVVAEPTKRMEVGQ